MGGFFVYILQSALCLAGLYLFYGLLLSQETFHRFNRCALLGLLLWSVLLPLLKITVTNPALVAVLPEWEVIWTDSATMAGSGGTLVAAFNWRIVLVGVYVVGLCIFLARWIIAFVRLSKLIRSGRQIRRTDGVVVVIQPQQVDPFSWMHYVVLSEKDWQEVGAIVLAHELAHIRQRHSWDLLFADFCIILQWFNPAAWLLRKELETLHEYEADEEVIRQGVDVRNYQMLLIKKAVGARHYSLANSLNHSSLKKRITMMLKKNSNPWARLKYAYVLPFAALASVAFARPEISNELQEISSVKVSDLTAMVGKSEAENASNLYQQKKDPVYTDVDEMPQFPGGIMELMKFMADNIRYPQEAQKDSLEGRVVVKFLVNKTGKISDCQVSRSVAPVLDEEAMRVIKSMPDWTPGKKDGKPVDAYYTVPVTFRLN